MKRCPLCGKEFEQENMCPSCGVLLIDAETNSAVKTAPEKKSRLKAVSQKETAVNSQSRGTVVSQSENAGQSKGIYIVVLIVVLAIVAGAAIFMVKSLNAKKEAANMLESSQETTEVQVEEVVPEDSVEEPEEVTEEAVAEPAAAVVSMNNIRSIVASSELSESGMTHSAGRVTDGNLDTAWVENVGGQGIDEELIVLLDDVYVVSGIRIAAGYQKDDYAYYNNSRPERIQIEFSDGTSEECVLDDAFGKEQVITFAEPKETTNVIVRIKSVYPGGKYEDTCISEISLF